MHNATSLVFCFVCFLNTVALDDLSDPRVALDALIGDNVGDVLEGLTVESVSVGEDAGAAGGDENIVVSRGMESLYLSALCL